MISGKKITALSLAAAVALGGIGIGTATTVSASSSNDADMARAYLKEMKKINKSCKKGVKYSLINVDNSGFQELAVDKDGYWTSLYTFNDNLCTLMEQDAYGTSGNMGYYYIPKKNSIKTDYSHDKDEYRKITFKKNSLILKTGKKKSGTYKKISGQYSYKKMVKVLKKIIKEN